MDIYLFDNTRYENIHFPVNPLDEMSITYDKKITTVDILDFGEVDIAEKGENITEISFNSFFPAAYDSSFCRYTDILTPEGYFNKLNTIRLDQIPAMLTITELGISQLVYLSSLERKIVAGEEKDIYYTVTFRTYREAKITVISENSSTPNTKANGGLNDNRVSSVSDFSAEDTVKVIANSISVKSGPGTTFDTLGTLKQGETLKIYRIYSSGWADCYYGTSGGFIKLDETINKA